MKPKTKLQKRIAEFVLPELTHSQKKYAYKHCFEHLGFRQKSQTVCMDCHQSFQTDKNHVKCSNCKTPLNVIDTRKRTNLQESYFCIVTTYKEFQVLRFFFIVKISKLYSERSCEFTECVQQWITPEGVIITKALLTNTFSAWGKRTWRLSSKLELRHHCKDNGFYIKPDVIWSKIKTIPVLKRNGFNGDFHNIEPLYLFEKILTDNNKEILFKSNQIELFKNKFDLASYWQSIKICIRHNYIVTDAPAWLDHINTLKFLDKDILSPKYICPEDFNLEHLRYTKLRRKVEEHIEFEKRKKRIEQDERIYKKQKSKFFDIKITNGVIDVVVLDSVKEFLAEEEAHKHCVFTNEYYTKKESLVLSARIGNKRIETVEVDLKRLEVVQSRGLHNTNTEYHDDIINLVNSNKKLFKRPKKYAITK